MSLAVTADTVALFKLDETSVPGTGYATAVDAGVNGLDLTETGKGTGAGVNYTHIVNGPRSGAYGLGDGRFARWFPGIVSGAHLERAGNAGAVAALLASYTLECWVRFDDVSSAGEVLSYGAVGETEATNYLTQLSIDSLGQLVMLWEHGSGSNVSVTDTGPAIVQGAWYHIAVTVDNSGGTATVKFYQNGSLTSTFSGLTKASGGTSSKWSLGATHLGALKSVKVSTAVLSAGVIATDATPATGDYRHAVDGQTFALWQLDEAPDAIEETDYGYHARCIAGDIEIVDPIANDGGKARHMNASTEYDAHQAYDAFRDMLEGDFTFEAWLRLDTGYDAATRGLWIWNDPGPDSQPSNLYSTEIMATTRKFRVFAEKDAGHDNFFGGFADTCWTSADPVFPAVADGYNKHFFSYVKWYDGALYHHELYLDGALQQSATTAEAFNHGEAGWLRFTAGTGAAVGGSIIPLLGTVDDMRWQGRRYTADEIEADYLDGLGVADGGTVGTGTGTGLPKIEARIRVPTAGWPIRVTDADGTNTRTIPAGDYYLNSVAPGGVRSFLSQLAATLSVGSVTYEAVCDDDIDDGTGRVTISADGTFAIAWTNAIVRDQLGFAGSGTSSASSATSQSQARDLWLPNGQRLPETPDPIAGEDTQDFGRPEWDYIVTTAPSGATTQSVFSQRRSDRLVFDPLLGRKMWLSNEAVANESLERFLLGVMEAGGVPVRYHNHRENDAVYWTQVFDGEVAQLKPVCLVPGWVGPVSHWRVELPIRKYFPLLLNGVFE